MHAEVGYNVNNEQTVTRSKTVDIVIERRHQVSSAKLSNNAQTKFKLKFDIVL